MTTKTIHVFHLNKSDALLEFMEAYTTTKPSIVALDTETMNEAMFDIIERYQIPVNVDLAPTFIWQQYVQQDEEAFGFFKSLAKQQGIELGDRWTKTEYNKCLKEARAKTHHLANALPTQYATVQCLQLGWATEEAMFVGYIQRREDDTLANGKIQTLLKCLAKDKVTLAIQNAQFDIEHIHASFGVMLSNRLYDTKHWASLLNSGKGLQSMSLSALSERYLSKGYRKLDENPLLTNWRETTDPARLAYAVQDIVAVLGLVEVLTPLLKANGLWQVVQLESVVLPRLIRTSIEGFKIDTELVKSELEEIKAKIIELGQRLGLGDVAPKQTAKVKELVLQRFGIQLASIEKKQCQQNAEVRNSNVYPWLEDYWLLNSLLTQQSLMEKRFIDKRVHAHYIPIATQASYGEAGGGAVTGRMSARPAVQNIPKHKRQQYVADEGKVLICTDYNAVEFWVASAMSGDPTMLRLNREGIDPHCYMASMVFNKPIESIGKKDKERQIAKGANFQFIFGQYHTTFAKQLASPSSGGIDMTEEEAKDLRDKFFRVYSELECWLTRQWEQGVIHGYTTTRIGRKRYWDQANSKPLYVKKFVDIGGVRYTSKAICERHADWSWRNICYNTPVQGTAGDIYKLAIAKMPTWVRQVAHIHDQFVGEVDADRAEEAKEVIESTMIWAAKQICPEVHIGVETDISKFWI